MVRGSAREVKSRATQLKEDERRRVEQEIDHAVSALERQMGRSAWRADQAISRTENSFSRTEDAINRAEQALRDAAGELDELAEGGGYRR